MFGPVLSAHDAALFDFDGTLAPNLDLPDLKRRVMRFTLDMTSLGEAQLAGYRILEIVEAAAALLRADGRNGFATEYAAAAERFINDYERDAAAATTLFPGVRDLLRDLASRNIAIGIVTRNCDAAVRAVFPDVDQYCPAVVTRDSATFVKPDPRHLAQCLAALGREPHRALMIGDGALDMETGTALGLTCIGVLGGSGDRAALTAAGAHHVVDAVVDLRSV